MERRNSPTRERLYVGVLISALSERNAVQIAALSSRFGVADLAWSIFRECVLGGSTMAAWVDALAETDRVLGIASRDALIDFLTGATEPVYTREPRS